MSYANQQFSFFLFWFQPKKLIYLFEEIPIFRFILVSTGIRHVKNEYITIDITKRRHLTWEYILTFFYSHLIQLLEKLCIYIKITFHGLIGCGQVGHKQNILGNKDRSSLDPTSMVPIVNTTKLTKKHPSCSAFFYIKFWNF